ncbi:MAG: hypothetical protein HXS44_06600 [Theionarchaea archaeon]|nr:hypothetical protein [Theionarchaea archaeon]
MCLMVRILYKFNTMEAFERAVDTVELHWGDKLIRGRVCYSNTKQKLTWKNLRIELNTAKAVNPCRIHGIIAVEHQ